LQNHIATLEATIKEIVQRKPDDSRSPGNRRDLFCPARYPAAKNHRDRTAQRRNRNRAAQRR